jgi:hypothetical protein
VQKRVHGGFKSARVDLKPSLQGASDPNLITRNEGVRGSNPRVGFSVERIPAHRPFVLSRQARRAHHRWLRGPRFESAKIPANALVVALAICDNSCHEVSWRIQRRVQSGLSQCGSSGMLPELCDQLRGALGSMDAAGRGWQGVMRIEVGTTRCPSVDWELGQRCCRIGLDGTFRRR